MEKSLLSVLNIIISFYLIMAAIKGQLLDLMTLSKL